MKKLLAVAALGCAAIVTLAGCGGGDNREKHTVEELKSTYEYQWTDTSKPIVNAKGAKELTFNVFSSQNASAKDYNEMDIMQTLFAQTNVNVTWDTVSETVYGEQKTLKLGKHTGIDAIYHAGMSPNEIIKYADRGTLLAIDEYLDYMPNFKKILETRSDIKKQVTNPDGHIYSMPRVEEMGLKQNPNLLFLNKTWTKKAIEEGNVDIGVDKSKVEEKLVDGLTLNADQMERLLQYFKDHDMNGVDGAGDERPMTFVYQNWQGNQCDLYGMFGVTDNPDHRIIKDGKVTYTIFQDGYYDATNYIHGWVSKGLIDKVSFEQTQDNFLANGKNTETYGAFYWWESATVVDHPENYICCAPLKGPANYNGHNYSDCQNVCVSNTPEVDTGELIFFNDTPNVEVLLTYFDRYYLPEISAQINYGPIGIAFEEEKDENGMLVPKKDTGGRTADEIRLENAPLGICYLTAEQWGTTVKMEPRAQLRLERLGLYATPFVAEDVEPIPNLQFSKKELDTLTRFETTTVNNLKENLFKYLFTSGVSESDWTKFTTAFNTNAVGGAEVTKVYQAAYNRYKAGN